MPLSYPPFFEGRHCGDLTGGREMASYTTNEFKSGVRILIDGDPFSLVENDGDFFHSMIQDNFEQHAATKAVVGDNAQWLKDGTVVIVTLWNNVPIVVTPPPHIELKVVETDPGLRGDTATGGQKSAKLETGAVVRVPLFINEGEFVKVDTRTSAYISRAKH